VVFVKTLSSLKLKNSMNSNLERLKNYWQTSALVFIAIFKKIVFLTRIQSFYLLFAKQI
jgi:hypothetical protein